MPLIRNLLLKAVQQIAADPRVRAKASEVIEQEIKPRAESAWRDTKPKLAAVRDELQDIAAEADPVTQPKEFAAKLKARFLDVQGRR
jgi:hypothetical protein